MCQNVLGDLGTCQNCRAVSIGLWS